MNLNSSDIDDFLIAGFAHDYITGCFGLLTRIEKHYGKMAHGSLCVTRAMQHELSLNWGIE